MTPPAAAATRTRTRRTAPPPRRSSGPVRSRHAGAATVSGPPPLALRLGGAVHGIAEHHLLERMIRGRAWIAILGVGLIGIVFMQVSMLRMNAGIGRAVDTASQLERENASMRASISELSSGDHVEAEAARMGLLLPSTTPRFLSAHGFDPARAASAITVPGQIPADALLTPSDSSAAALAPTGVAPSPDTAAAAPATPTAASTPTAPSSTTATIPPVTPQPTTPAPTSTSTSTAAGPSTTSGTTPVTPTQSSTASTATTTGGAAPTATGR